MTLIMQKVLEQMFALMYPLTNHQSLMFTEVIDYETE
jgi:hypothetical protein